MWPCGGSSGPSRRLGSIHIELPRVPLTAQEFEYITDKVCPTEPLTPGYFTVPENAEKGPPQAIIFAMDIALFRSGPPEELTETELESRFYAAYKPALETYDVRKKDRRLMRTGGFYTSKDHPSSNWRPTFLEALLQTGTTQRGFRTFITRLRPGALFFFFSSREPFDTPEAAATAVWQRLCDARYRMEATALCQVLVEFCERPGFRMYEVRSLRGVRQDSGRQMG